MFKINYNHYDSRIFNYTYLFSSLVYGAVTIRQILSEPQGSDRMIEIASAIQEGAQAYLNRQYITISIVGLLITILLFYLIHNPFVSIGFVIGAFLLV